MILHCSCGKKWSLKDDIARPGRKIACRACQNPILVPQNDSSELEEVPMVKEDNTNALR